MSKEKYGFVYLWRDRKYKRYYVGCHWGSIDDGYICSSNWMRKTYKRRPQDFRRRILKTNLSRIEMYVEEQRYLDMQKPEEKKTRYYNLYTKNGNLWHKYPESVKTVGQKISHSKTGKSVPASPDKGAKISAAKKGKPLTEEHKAALKGIKKKPHTDEWKQQNSERMKQQWSDGTRKKAEPKITMPREEQDKLCSQQLKNRWSDPIWAENQKNKLKESWAKRKQYINKQKEQVKLVN
jgi:hypothetical protein